MAARFAGLVLAGGAGQRYGTPKALALLPDGRSFLAACVELLAEAGAAPIVATLPPDMAPLESPAFSALHLPVSGLAMFDSLRLGLKQLCDEQAWERVVVLPVDHPLVRAVSVRALAVVDAPAALPLYTGRHGHPVMLARTTAEHIVAGELPGPTLRTVLRTVGSVDVAVDDPGVRANCNTPEALAAAWNNRHI